MVTAIGGYIPVCPGDGTKVFLIGHGVIFTFTGELGFVLTTWGNRGRSMGGLGSCKVLIEWVLSENKGWEGMML
jgi:hypothetical protein